MQVCHVKSLSLLEEVKGHWNLSMTDCADGSYSEKKMCQLPCLVSNYCRKSIVYLIIAISLLLCSNMLNTMTVLYRVPTVMKNLGKGMKNF